MSTRYRHARRRYTVTQAAQRIGCSTSTVYQLAARGELHRYRGAHPSVFDGDSVDRRALARAPGAPDLYTADNFRAIGATAHPHTPHMLYIDPWWPFTPLDLTAPGPDRPRAATWASQPITIEHAHRIIGSISRVAYNARTGVLTHHVNNHPSSAHPPALLWDHIRAGIAAAIRAYLVDTMRGNR